MTKFSKRTQKAPWKYHVICMSMNILAILYYLELFERKAFSEDNKDILNNVNFALKVS